MSKAWFAVLSQSSMKIFTRERPTAPLKHVRTLRNDWVHLKGEELIRHVAGVTRKGKNGSQRNMLSSDEPPHMLVVENFAQKMASFLDEQRKKEKFKELHIAAEPKFLGLVRKSMTGETKKTVCNWVLKDLAKADTQRLGEEFARI